MKVMDKTTKFLPHFPMWEVQHLSNACGFTIRSWPACWSIPGSLVGGFTVLQAELHTRIGHRKECSRHAHPLMCLNSGAGWKASLPSRQRLDKPSVISESWHPACSLSYHTHSSPGITHTAWEDGMVHHLQDIHSDTTWYHSECGD